MKLFIVISLLLGTSFSQAREFSAVEPSYCELENIQKLEIPEYMPLVWRARFFRLGGVTIAGMAVGLSKTSFVVALSQKYSKATRAENYCTWYLNHGNIFAHNAFNDHYLPNPTKLGEREAAAVYMTRLGTSFDEGVNSFVYCAEKHGYIALGCNGQKHRGPTVFGMILAFSGCQPEKALKIVNHYWGLNGVPANTRLAIIREAYAMGQLKPHLSVRLRQMLDLSK